MTQVQGCTRAAHANAGQGIRLAIVVLCSSPPSVAGGGQGGGIYILSRRLRGLRS